MSDCLLRSSAVQLCTVAMNRFILDVCFELSQHHWFSASWFLLSNKFHSFVRDVVFVV